jgi:hypothetical protein
MFENHEETPIVLTESDRVSVKPTPEAEIVIRDVVIKSQKITIEDLTTIANAYMSVMLEWGHTIPENVKTTLRSLEDMGTISAPKKTVTIEGEVIRTYNYSVEVDIPIFDDEEGIDHNDFEDEIIAEAEDTYDVYTEIRPSNY